MHYALLTPAEQNPKTAKGLAHKVMTFPLHLAPADLSGFEVCPMRGGCTSACLNLAGRGIFTATQAARVRRTRWFFENRITFMQALVRDISRAIRHAEKRGYVAAFRLNATSDIPWHRVPCDGFDSIMARFPTVQFYDYTKVAKRLTSETLPANYHLTFSLAENNHDAAARVIAAGGNIAAVFRDKATVARAIASRAYVVPVINGDETDLRFTDPRGVIVALYAKGPAKKDRSGFVIDLP